MTTVAPAGPGLLETTSTILEWRKWNGLSAVLTSHPLSTFGINLARLTNTATLADLWERRVEDCESHITAVCDQNGDQYEKVGQAVVVG